MRGLGLRDGLLAAVKADTLSLVAYQVGMFSWMGFRAWISGPAADNLVLLADDADCHDYWFRYGVSRKLVAHQSWDQGEDVARPVLVQHQTENSKHTGSGRSERTEIITVVLAVVAFSVLVQRLTMSPLICRLKPGTVGLSKRNKAPSRRRCAA